MCALNLIVVVGGVCVSVAIVTHNCTSILVDITRAFVNANNPNNNNKNNNKTEIGERLNLIAHYLEYETRLWQVHSKFANNLNKNVNSANYLTNNFRENSSL